MINLVSINNFKISENKYLFFDIFSKDNKIHMILPIYNDVFNSDDIDINIEGIKIEISEKYIKDSSEPIIIYIYDYTSNKSEIVVNINYKNIIKIYNLQHIISNKKNNLSITTLFKNDFKLFPIFYQYYLEQGVEHFYMIDNDSTDEPLKILQKYIDQGIVSYYFKPEKHKQIDHCKEIYDSENLKNRR